MAAPAATHAPVPSWLDRAVLLPVGGSEGSGRDGSGTASGVTGADAGSEGDDFITSFAVLPTPPPRGTEPKPLVPQPCQLHVGAGDGDGGGSGGGGERAGGMGEGGPGLRLEITRVTVLEPVPLSAAHVPRPVPTPASRAAGSGHGTTNGDGAGGGAAGGHGTGGARVRFSTVTVHYHERQVGGSSGVPSSGVDLGLGWGVVDSPRVLAVDEYEAAKLGDDAGSTTGGVGTKAGGGRGKGSDSDDSSDDSDSSDGKAWRYDLYGKLDARERRRIMQAAGVAEADILTAIDEHKVRQIARAVSRGAGAPMWWRCLTPLLAPSPAPVLCHSPGRRRVFVWPRLLLPSVYGASGWRRLAVARGAW